MWYRFETSVPHESDIRNPQRGLSDELILPFRSPMLRARSVRPKKPCSKRCREEMEKRYQVFVSSTYADLKDERQRVTQTLMEMDCIPAGMELFPAADEEQWEFIKRVIDDCDYYLLIIGGRYGSVTADGISYTEKEYDYAISVGLKVLAFVHERPDDIPVGKSDIALELRAKLEAFRSKVSTNRLVKFWKAAAELPGMVALSLSKTMKLYPAVRASAHFGRDG